jgi:hypothetical protein
MRIDERRPNLLAGDPPLCKQVRRSLNGAAPGRDAAPLVWAENTREFSQDQQEPAGIFLADM